ncbi:dTDP-4-dehydrorhamnose reductase [Luteithermobacter gelatinilyticus]|uniref:dTDP-4-dehydrorhamnose reductase n=1 Tax=Luteithermobacter gelatinilyticus TaxID=2582913 RepID=UPI0011059285|nr:dTDP-4-dehydrorhamnose reductase [Luteithermobacter gelatinilyticus]
MKVMITGARGQLGRELADTAPQNIDIKSCARQDLDITDSKSVVQWVKDFCPDVIINAAAYTAVDKAEKEKEQAFAINQDGVRNLAVAANIIGAKLLHISTDFVFNGQRSEPYTVEALPDPLNVYGASKLAGENILREVMPGRHVIVRTSWVYSSYGHNFVKTMLRLMKEREKLSVVADQIGGPTWAKGLARFLWEIAKRNNFSGTLHWSDAGVASWYDFAIAIFEEAKTKNMLTRDILISPVPSTAYPTPAKRPNFSVLDKMLSWEIFDVKAVHWRENLRLMLSELNEK